MIPVIICGSRTFDYGLILPLVLGPILLPIFDDIEIWEGGANGADYCGRLFARYYHRPFKTFEADWDKHGKAAGPIRNLKMAQDASKYPEAYCISFWDGKSKGTKNMLQVATDNKLIVHPYIYKPRWFYHKELLMDWQDKFKKYL